MVVPEMTLVMQTLTSVSDYNGHTGNWCMEKICRPSQFSSKQGTCAENSD
jgi:hypothetical protein